MRKIILLAIIIEFINGSFMTGLAQEKVEDNQELIEIYKSDQADRINPIDWEIINRNDSIREARVYELLDSNKVITSEDYRNAAIVFQHGNDAIAYGMAVKLMKKSIELDSTRSKWLLAAAIDRNLMSRNKPQIYGTQYLKNEGQPYELYEIDTTQITDAERIEYGVETLAQQREKVKRLNSKKLLELTNEGKSITEIIQFVKQEDFKTSKYDLSESGINNFGYQLMNQGRKEDALKIFKLNTELYPNGFNTFDSYGECLLDLGDKENAIKAYKRSLKLNPENENAKKILLEIN